MSQETIDMLIDRIVASETRALRADLAKRDEALAASLGELAMKETIIGSLQAKLDALEPDLSAAAAATRGVAFLAISEDRIDAGMAVEIRGNRVYRAAPKP